MLVLVTIAIYNNRTKIFSPPITTLRPPFSIGKIKNIFVQLLHTVLVIRNVWVFFFQMRRFVVVAHFVKNHSPSRSVRMVTLGEKYTDLLQEALAFCFDCQPDCRLIISFFKNKKISFICNGCSSWARARNPNPKPAIVCTFISQEWSPGMSFQECRCNHAVFVHWGGPKVQTPLAFWKIALMPFVLEPFCHYLWHKC